MEKLVITLLIAAAICSAGCMDPMQNNETSNYPSPSPAITPLIVYNLEEAYTKFGEDLPVPSYLPEGYLFLYATHYGRPDNRTSLIYGHEDGDEIHITQVPLRGDPCLEAVAWETTEVMVNGTPGNLTSGETKNTLRWCSEEYSYYITGRLGEDEMLRIAASTLNVDTDKSKKKSLDQNSEKKQGNISLDEAEKIASDYIRDKDSDLDIKQTMARYINPHSEGLPGEYKIHYSRIIDGVRCLSDGITVTVNPVNGCIMSYYKKWTMPEDQVPMVSAEEIKILDSDEERIKEIENTFPYISSEDSDWVLTNGGDIILVSGTVPDFTKEVNKIIWDEKLRNVISDSRSDLKKYMILNEGPLILYGLNYLGSIEVGWYENITADPIILNEICNIFYSHAEEEGIKDLPIVVKYSSQVKGDVSADQINPDTQTGETPVQEENADNGILSTIHVGTMSTDGDGDTASAACVGSISAPAGQNTFTATYTHVNDVPRDGQGALYRLTVWDALGVEHTSKIKVDWATSGTISVQFNSHGSGDAQYELWCETHDLLDTEKASNTDFGDLDYYDV